MELRSQRLHNYADSALAADHRRNAIGRNLCEVEGVKVADLCLFFLVSCPVCAWSVFSVRLVHALLAPGLRLVCADSAP